MKQNKVEKLLAGVLSISLAMGVNVMPAFAAQVQGPPYEDMSRVYLTKNYELANTGTLSPEETFTFTIDPGTVTDASEGIEAADYMPIVGDVTYQQGEAGSANKTRQIEIQLPGGSYRLEVLACLVVPASEQAIFAPGKWRSDAGGLLPFVEENALQMDAQALRALEKEPEGAQFLAMATCSGEYTDARTVVLARMEPMSDLQNGKEESLS